MGGLRTLMPITYITATVGSLALAGIPPFAGFFSKDAIIEATRYSRLWGADYAYWAVLLGVFVTAFYSFRLLFMTFHGNNHADPQTRRHLHESPGVVTWPLVALAVPSVIAGFVFFGPVISGTFFGDAIYVDPAHDVVAQLAEINAGKHGIGLIMATLLHGLLGAPVWLAVAGIGAAWYCYRKNPAFPARIAAASGPIYRMLQNKYGFDDFYQAVFAKGSVAFGGFLARRIDDDLVDGVMVNGSARLVGLCAGVIRNLQTGFTYHYAFAMIVGLFCLVTFFVWL